MKARRERDVVLRAAKRLPFEQQVLRGAQDDTV
jgi:hypothetical protein